MACSGAHCTNHSTGTSTCAGHRPQNSSVSPVVGAVGVGAPVYAWQIESLRDAIRIEIARWQVHAYYSGVTSNAYYSTISTQSSAVGQKIDEMISLPTVNSEDEALMIVGGPGSPGASTFGNPSAFPPAATVGLAPDVSPPLINYNFVEGNKITMNDYQSILNNYMNLREDCICNSDCNCNAVCACHNDCGCNYSDMRLKMEIVYC
jgi:hypothetical protein